MAFKTFQALQLFIPFTWGQHSSSFVITDPVRMESTVDCPSGTPCFVHCAEEASCSGLTINCPDDNECAIVCDETDSCSGVTIIGGYRSQITIDCNGSNSCKNAEIDGADAEDLTIRGCSESGSCIGVTLFCPESIEGVAKCIVIADEEFGGTLSDPLKIYAVNGFIDINITGTTDSDHHIGTMYCADDYNSSCSIDDDTHQWQCDSDIDTLDSCNFNLGDLDLDQSDTSSNSAGNTGSDPINTTEVVVHNLEIPLFVAIYVGLCIIIVVLVKKTAGSRKKSNHQRRRSRNQAVSRSNMSDLDINKVKTDGDITNTPSTDGSSGDHETGSSDGGSTNSMNSEISSNSPSGTGPRMDHRRSESMETHSGASVDGSVSDEMAIQTQ